MKKIFLVAKVHEMEPATIMSVQQEIQNDFDSVTGDRRVVFSACNPSDNEFELHSTAHPCRTWLRWVK